MDVHQPRSLDEALEMKAVHPEAVPIAGGTDVMVELNLDHRRPPALIDVSELPELRVWRSGDDGLFLGAGVTYSRIMRELHGLSALVQASRTIGSPQIRNRGTVGGNLGTASPAGDALPVLAAYDCEVVLGSSATTRTVPWDSFLVDVKRTALEPDELILGARVHPPRGPGSFSKIGTRNAMVISVVGLCLVVDEDERTIRVALGSVGPTVFRVPAAEVFAAEMLARAGTWDEPVASVPDSELEDFAELVGNAALPIDDVRGSAAYRRHACRILAGRALRWALAERVST